MRVSTLPLAWARKPVFAKIKLYITRLTGMSKMSPLQKLIERFRAAAVTEREKGTYFEELILAYLRNEAT